jgi:CRP-like cAMP-binding protein
MAQETELDELLRIELFGVMEPDALRALVFSAEMRLLRAGDVLYRKGETADGGYLLTKGAVALETGDAGRPAIKILKPIVLLGEIAMIAATTRPATAMAREPATVLKLSRALFHQTLEKFPATALRVRQLFKDRLVGFVSSVEFDS